MLASQAGFLMVELDKGTPEYHDVVRHLESKDAQLVLGIKRIQHPGHYKQHESLFCHYGGDREHM